MEALTNETGWLFNSCFKLKYSSGRSGRQLKTLLLGEGLILLLGLSTPTGWPMAGNG